MADESRFDFCPLCGALARDGVCQSCGHKDQKVMDEIEAKRQATAAGQPVYNQAPYANQQPVYGQQPMQNMQQPVYNQASYANQQPVYGQQPMQNMQQPVYNQAPYINQQPAYNQPPKKNNLWVVILILALVLLMTVIAIIIGVTSIVKDSEDKRVEEVMGDADEDDKDSFFDEDETDSAESEETDDVEKETDSDITEAEDAAIDLEDYVHEKYDVTDVNLTETGQDTSLPYYSGPYNAVADDLSYQVAFVEEVFYSEEKAVYLSVEYPQIVSGLEEYSDYINEILYYEYECYESLVTEEFAQLMETEDDVYQCFVNSYVTYMDENILSIVFKEELYMQLASDSFSVLDFYCINFDLTTGMIMDNTEILHLDENFAIDFRQREIQENGDEALTYFSDQEILEMLKDPSQLVIFYTPYGMEVGLNLEDIIVYVMYDDYTKFLNSY